MRKSLFLTLVLSLCMADFGAFAATAPNTRNTRIKSDADNMAPSSARSVVRSANQSAVRSANQGVAARAASIVKGRSAVATSANTAKVAFQPNDLTQETNISNTPSGVVSRSATKKAISLGTKVSEATENTVVSEECQNAYYGCMDAFCMLDNAAGGRCQCSNRSAELDEVLDEIMRLDEQSARIASEGVERVQMGEFADQINTRAKAIENGIDTASKGSKTGSASSIPGLIDLSSWSSTAVFDVDTDSVFAETSAALNNNGADISLQTGDNLHNAAANMCSSQIPQQCKSSLKMLQMAYAQKIKSDCVGYENALKQQRNASQQNLLTAQKAVREAVLTEVREQNKYTTTGECAIAFAQCMQTTGGCGADYTGCVTLAATENVKSNRAGSKAKQTTIPGLTSGVKITLAATTMEQLLAKKEICASVTKQCVNVNKNDAVWNVFLRNAAPALKSAELVAEQNLRSSCIPTLAECFKTACKSQFADNDESYDICLSNPETYKSLCKVQLEPCLEATGGDYTNPKNSTLWNGLVAMLNSMKVDACTKEIKTCLTDRCGEDYSGCIGLDTESIGDLCPVEKLTACVSDGRYADGKDGDNTGEIRSYVAEIAKGLALQIDNALADACQNAANEAMIKVCGDTESCENVDFDLSSLTFDMKVMACPKGDENGMPASGSGTNRQEAVPCYDNLAMFGDTSTADDGQMSFVNKLKTYEVIATLVGVPKDMSSITFGTKGNFAYSGTDTTTGKVKDILNNTLTRFMNQIDSDPKVTYCMKGRSVQSFNSTDFVGETTGDNKVRFPNLTDEYKYVIANALLSKLSEKNAELTEGVTEQLAEMNNQINELIYAEDEQKIDSANAKYCEETLGHYKDYEEEIAPDRNNCGHTYLSYSKSLTYVVGTYDLETNICTLDTKRFDCLSWETPAWCHDNCSKYDEGTVISTQQIQMAKTH